jgi:riboflavin kinase/FMN adenylyltransferase
MRRGSGGEGKVRFAVRVWRDDAAVVAAGIGRSVVTVGVFDGVHRGHQRIVHRALARAAELRLPAIGVTFDPLPEHVLRRDAKPQLLTTLERRIALLGELGLDGVDVINFTEEFSQLSAEEFVQSVLVDSMRAVDVVVGSNFRFGRRASGDVSTLRHLGQVAGFMVDAVQLAGPVDGPTDQRVFSSSWVRERIAVGDVESAAEVLGRPHRLEGVVVHGDHRGRELGYPTANLEVSAALAVPADGVYAGWLDAMPAAISIGTNPTFDGVSRRIEAYAIDRVGLDLYGQTMTLDLVARLRPMVAFDGVEALVRQMADDVDQARRLLR